MLRRRDGMFTSDGPKDGGFPPTQGLQAKRDSKRNGPRGIADTTRIVERLEASYAQSRVRYEQLGHGGFVSGHGDQRPGR
jgi:hypothetical protein